MNKYLKTAAVCLAFGTAFVATAALAQGEVAIPLSSGNNPFTTTLSVLIDTFKNIRAVVYVAGGFALVGMAVASMLGKISWKWLAAVAIALAVVAMAGQIVDYATGHTQGRTGTQTGQFGDTLTQ